jgi:hypothetical protein
MGCQGVPSTKHPNTSSTLPPPQVDTCLFTYNPCVAPCWFGLELGKSNKDEVLTVLQDISFIDPKTIDEILVGYWDPIQEENIQAKLITADCVQPKNRQCIAITVAKDNLKIIGLIPHYGITLDDLVDHLGGPDYAQNVLAYPINEYECSIRFIWKEKQIITSHPENNKEVCRNLLSEKEINASQIDLARSITYFLPEYIEFTIESGNVFPWIGFEKP